MESGVTGQTVENAAARDGGFTAESIAGIVLMSAAMTAFGMAPLFFGALAEEKRIALSQVGLAVPIQAFVMGMVNLGAGAVLKRKHQRPVTAISSCLLAALQLLYIGRSGTGALILCALSSIPQGLILWVAMGVIARSPTPAQLMAYSEVALTLMKLLVSGLLTAILIPWWVINAGFVVAGIIVAVGFFAAFALSNHSSGAAVEARLWPTGPPIVRGWLALVAVLLVWSGTMAVLSYLLPLAGARGLTPRAAHSAFVALLIGQIAGGVVAASVSKRLPFAAALGLGALIALSALATFRLSTATWQFLSAAATFGLAFAFAAPFMMPMLLAMDASKRAAGKFMGAALIGSASGPLLVSRIVESTGTQSALYMAGGAIVLATVLLTLLCLSGRSRVAAQPNAHPAVAIDHP